MIPVHLDCTPTLVRAECAKCGKCAEAAVSQDPDDGGPAARKKRAKALALAKLTAVCEERLPWGSTPHHHERGIPRGVSIFAEDAHGQLWELSVNEKGKLETVACGCAFDANVVVIPDTQNRVVEAIQFAKELQKRGYWNAKAVKPGYAKQGTKS